MFSSLNWFRTTMVFIAPTASASLCSAICIHLLTGVFLLIVGAVLASVVIGKEWNSFSERLAQYPETSTEYLNKNFFFFVL